MAKPKSRDRAVARTLAIVLVLNLFVASIKLGVGYSMGALSLIADGVHSLLDGSSNVVGLVGIAIASRPPDRNHPYGHRRFETLAAVLIGLLIGAGFVEIAQEVFRGLTGTRHAPDVSWLAASAVMATIVINLGISRYESARARQLQSSILEADSKHTLSDAMAAGAVLIGFGGVALGFEWADIAAAAVVSLFIAKTAWAILTANLRVLTDQATLEPEQVHRVALSVEGVRGAHRVRSRGSHDAICVDLHVHLDPNLSLTEAHAKTHEVMRALQSAFPEVSDIMIHTEPADGREKDPSKLIPDE